MAFDKHLREFIANSLTGDHLDFRSVALDRGQRLRLDLVFKTRGKADGAQHAKFVFRKTLGWIANGADDAGFQIIASADEVEHFAGRYSSTPGSSIMPLMVKSRRATSSRGSWLKRTSSGWRPSEYP